ncbi:pseudouridine synthase [Lentisphaerota bacterium WC36G]|nr:rRNA pseudouridine synthase [Lentisphaerae bacterium WC36]
MNQSSNKKNFSYKATNSKNSGNVKRNIKAKNHKKGTNKAISNDLRLQKFMADCDVASRRACAEIIKKGKVAVNGNVVTEPGFRVTAKDEIICDGVKLKVNRKKYYIMLNKPPGYTCSTNDRHAKKLALDLINFPDARLFGVGRLDKESEGLILFTNDGDFANKIIHPSNEIEKRYLVDTNKSIDSKKFAQMRKGIMDDGEELRAKYVKQISPNRYMFIMNEGKKREIRRLVKWTKCRVEKLQRITIGALDLGELALGKWRHLTEKELKAVVKRNKTAFK